MSWEIFKLEEVCEIIAGQSPESKYYNQEVKGIPFFQGKADFGKEFPTVRYWTTKPTKIAKPFDILLSVRAPVGPTNICDVESCIGRGLSSIRTTDKTFFKYVYFFFKFIEPKLKNSGNGSTFSAITTKDVKEIKIPLPPLSIQKEIAEKLDKADALRKKDQELLKQYDELAQSVFIEMFGDPVKNEKSWEIATIVNLVKNQRNSLKRGPFGGALKKEIFVEKGFLVYEQFHALNNDFNFERYFITKAKFDELKGFEVKPKDIIISCSGIYLGKLAIVPEGAKEGIINQALLKLTLNESEMTNDFFVFHFRQQNFRERYYDSNRGAGIPNFPPMSEFKRFPFIKPPIELQKKFATIIENIEHQKKLLKQQAKESENLFQSLLQESFA